MIAGEPQRQFTGQQEYCNEIQSLIAALGLDSVARIDVSYLPVEDQVSAIQACHVGIFAYQDPFLSSSGTVPFVLSAGRPVICTPFAHAKDKKRTSGAVTLADKFSASAIAASVMMFMEGRNDYLALTEQTYGRTREWLWKDVGRRYLREYMLAARDGASKSDADVK